MKTKEKSTSKLEASRYTQNKEELMTDKNSKNAEQGVEEFENKKTIEWEHIYEISLEDS